MTSFIADLDGAGARSKGKEETGAFPFGSAQGQDDGVKQATTKADPYGMTSKRTDNHKCNSNGRD